MSDRAPTVARPLLFLGLGLAVAGMALAGLDLADLRAWVDSGGAWRDAHPLMAALAFLGLYVAAAALSLPLAALVTLAAGALFGFWEGLLLASFASAIGATLAFLAARLLLRDWVRARLGGRATRLEERLRRDGPLYLFTLRLVPVVPFFAVNLAMGLTPIRVATFYGVSQAGMLLGTAAYVKAGTCLAALDSLSGLLS